MASWWSASAVGCKRKAAKQKHVISHRVAFSWRALVSSPVAFACVFGSEAQALACLRGAKVLSSQAAHEGATSDGPEDYAAASEALVAFLASAPPLVDEAAPVVAPVASGPLAVAQAAPAAASWPAQPAAVLDAGPLQPPSAPAASSARRPARRGLPSYRCPAYPAPWAMEVYAGACVPRCDLSPTSDTRP